MTSNTKEYNKEYYLKNKERIQEYKERTKEYRLKRMREYSLKNKEQKREYYLKNKEHIKKYQKEYQIGYYLKNKEHFKEYRLKNKERLREYRRKYRKKYYLKNKEHLQKYKNRYDQERKKTDPSFKLKVILRQRVRGALKGSTKSKRTMELIGCTIDELWTHLESKFTNGMTRENHGTWHVDHIKACATFNLSDPVQQRECFNYTNLQPLWAFDNLSKGAR
tara:strand:+ start:90 stop:752 length:663 start_codon:yes stop_codon:yes gene_type:complete